MNERKREKEQEIDRQEREREARNMCATLYVRVNGSGSWSGNVCASVCVQLERGPGVYVKSVQRQIQC